MMMKFTKLIIGFICIGILLIAAPYIKGDQGYVLIAFGSMTIEGSIVQFGMTVVLFCIAIWLAIWLVKLIYTTLILPSRWWQSRQIKHQANYLQAGIDYMILGHWQQAINQFAKVKREERLESAQKLTGVCNAQIGNTSSVLLTDKTQTSSNTTSEFAQLAQMVKNQEFTKALDLLNGLKLNMAKQPLPFQQLSLAILAHNFDWNEVATRLPKLNKLVKKQNDDDAFIELQQLNQNMLHNAFSRYVQTQSVNQLQSVWLGWPKNIKADLATQSAYIQTLSENKQSQLIEPELLQINLLEHQQWLLDNIRALFLNASYVAMDQLFIKIQNLVNKQPDNKSLLTVYAYLAAGQKDFQLARQALEQVVYSNNNDIDKRLYAMVLAELGELRYSLDVFKSIDVA